MICYDRALYMLTEIKFIQNVGRFESTQNNKASFGQCTLMFGENGWGKSTLADIFRSLTTQSPGILTGRRTLTAAAESKVVLRFETATAQFVNGSWTGPHPRISVYDSTFINQNICSGDIVSPEHLKNQFGLVVGNKGVELVGRLVELDGENRENNSLLATAQAELSGIHRSVAPAGVTLDAFLGIAAKADIERALAEVNADLQRLRRSKELKAAAEPLQLSAPHETNSFRNMLAETVDGIAATVADKVRAHIKAHEGKPAKAVTAHESWLESGGEFVQTDDCPFCGQQLNDRTLVDSYKDFFSDAYKTLATSIRETRQELVRYRTGEFRRIILKLVHQNDTHCAYWHEAAGVKGPSLPDIHDVLAEMESAAAELEDLFAAKQADLIHPITDSSAEAALATWEAARTKFITWNEQTGVWQAAIQTFKDSIDISRIPDLEQELASLQTTHRRHQPDVVELVGRLDDLKAKKLSIAAEKEQVRTHLNNHGKAITQDLGKSINTYLGRLNAGFRIDYQEPDYRSKEPTAVYNILINEIPVSPRADALDKPSFRNTLSAGDKSVLAFALFLAKLNADPNLKETIVLLDDPFTSLDNSRRQFIAIEIRKLCSRAHQVIVMSHDKNFLRLLWDKIDHSIISSIALQTAAPGVSTFVPYDIEAATQPRHITERMQIEEFLEGETHAPQFIRTRLRTVCEDFYRKGDPALFGAAASLEEIIRRLIEAPSEHPYKGALDDLRDINEYSRGENHAAIAGNPSEDTTIEELKEFCRRVLSLTHGM